MTTTYNFLICKHPIDGLRLALRLFSASQERRLVLVARHSSTSAMYFGHWCPPDYYGLPGLLRFDVEQLSVKMAEDGKKTHVVFSNPESELFSNSELLDRLRLRLASWAPVNVLLDYELLARDLPPVLEGDSLLCAWHIRDAMDEASLEGLKAARAAAESAGCKFVGPALYARTGIQEDQCQKLFESVKTELPPAASETLLKL